VSCHELFDGESTDIMTDNVCLFWCESLDDISDSFSDVRNPFSVDHNGDVCLVVEDFELGLQVFVWKGVFFISSFVYPIYDVVCDPCHAVVVALHFILYFLGSCKGLLVCTVGGEFVTQDCTVAVLRALRKNVLDPLDGKDMATLESDSDEGRELGGHSGIGVDAEVIERTRQERDEGERAGLFEYADLEDEGATWLQEVERVAGHGDAVEHVPVLVVRPVLYGAFWRHGIVV